MSDLSILLVDDHPVVRAGYRKLLERQPGFRVVAEAESATEAYQLYRKVSPNIVIMDLSLPGASGLEAIRLIRGYDNGARILVFTMHQGTPFALKAFEAGAMGYVTKSSPPAELINAMNNVAKGRQAFSQDIAQGIAAEKVTAQTSPVDSLATREVEILALIASGLTTEAISKTLSLSHKTIQNYHSTIKAKLNINNDAQLVWLAIKAGIVYNNSP